MNGRTLSANEILEVYNDGGPVIDSASFDISWTSAGFTTTIRPATGHGFRDHADRATNPVRIDASKGACIRFPNNVGATAVMKITAANIVIDGMQIESTAGSAVVPLMWFAAGSGASITINNSILNINTGAACVRADDNSFKADTSVFITRGAVPHGVYLVTPSAASAIKNCVVMSLGVTSSGTGINSFAGGTPPLVQNTAVYGYTADFAGPFNAGSTNNATNLAAFGGTQAGASGQVSLTSADFTNLTVGSENLRPTSGSKLVNTGVAVGLTTDISGTSRPQGGATDIGPAEYVSSTPTAPTVTTNPSNQSVGVGSTATFTAVFAGSPTPTYQWQRNGADISGATLASYTTPATTVTGGTANNGDVYRCGATNASGGPIYTTGATLTVTAGGATAVTLSGPSTGVVGAASTNFTVGANATISGTITVTPSDSGGGGTFTPTSVNISSGSPTATFTYTPASTGVKTISVTNSGGLTNPSTIAYTVAAGPGTITTNPWWNAARTLLLSTTIPKVAIIRLSDMVTVLNLTNQVTNASTGRLTFTDAAISPGAAYLVVASNADGSSVSNSTYTST
jgi:hypothetical protein